MSGTHRHRRRHLLAAITLAAPSVVFASPSPTAVARPDASEMRPAPESASVREPSAPVKGSLLRAVVESLGEHRGQGHATEASPFEPPSKPPGRPPDNPGHHDPPNSTRQPPDRPPRGH
jgi:hypothetical protein